MKNSNIAWTDDTWNPIHGCSRVSEGCRNCYAEVMAARFSGPGQFYEGLAEYKNGKPRWTGQLKFDREKLLIPMSATKPRM